MKSMFSTPLIACSSGVATVRAIVSAEAPGKLVVIWIVGGTMFGYCATGRNANVARPNRVMKTLTTGAKRGGSMKKCARAMVFARLVSIGSEPDRAGRRRNFRPRPDGGYSVDDDSVGGRKT